MHRWKNILAQGALAGSLTSLLSTAVLALTGRRQGGGAAAALADTPSTPPQGCTPGAAHRLSSGAMLGICAAFAVGLAAGTLALREQRRKERQAKAPVQEADEAPFVVRRVRAGQVI
jgi:Na+(H+)/acetate symporter ActP